MASITGTRSVIGSFVLILQILSCRSTIFRDTDLMIETEALANAGKSDYSLLDNKNVTLILDDSDNIDHPLPILPQDGENVFQFSLNSANISSAVRMKLLLSRPKYVKIILLVDRDRTTEALSNFHDRITDLIQNINKFKSSIGIIVRDRQRNARLASGAIEFLNSTKFLDIGNFTSPDNLKYSPSSGSDYDKFLSKRTINKINRLATKMNNLIANELKRNDNEPSVVPEPPKDFLRWLDKTFETFPNIESDDTASLRTLAEALNSLQLLNPKLILTHSSIWLKIFQENRNIIEPSILRSKLSNITSSLGSYEDVSYYRKTKTEILKTDENFIELIELRELFDKFTNGKRYSAGYDFLKNAKSDRSNIESVLSMWRMTKLQSECHGRHELWINGSHVFLSDLRNTQGCPAGVKLLRITAVERVYIDADVIGEGVQVMIVAPRWEIVGSRRFLLHGKTGGYFSGYVELMHGDGSLSISVDGGKENVFMISERAMKKIERLDGGQVKSKKRKPYCMGTPRDRRYSGMVMYLNGFSRCTGQGLQIDEPGLSDVSQIIRGTDTIGRTTPTRSSEIGITSAKLEPRGEAVLILGRPGSGKTSIRSLGTVMPGFGNTRNSSLDINSTYFIKNTIDRLERVKFVLTVDHSDGFAESIQHLTRIIKNVETLKTSVALVVTKVEDAQLSEIAVSLRSLETNSLGRAAIEAFLENDSRKIIILRNHSEQSPALRRMLEECTTFRDVVRDDFGYSVSEETEFHLSEMFERIHEDILARVEAFVAKLREDCSKEEGNYQDLHELYDYLNERFERVHSILSRTKDGRSLQDFGIDLEADFPGDENIAMFRELSEREWSIDWPRLTVPLRVVLSELDEISAWYGFVLRIHFELSRNRMKITIPVPVASDDARGELFDGFFKQLFGNLNMAEPTAEMKQLRHLRINQARLKGLLDVVHSVRGNDLSTSYNSESQEWRIKGGYVKMSDVPWKVFENGGYRAITILASEEIHFDVGVNVDLEIFKLTIIAPVWRIEWRKRIFLHQSHHSELNTDETAFLGVGRIFQDSSNRKRPYVPLTSTDRMGSIKDLRLIELGNQTAEMWDNLDRALNFATCNLGHKRKKVVGVIGMALLYSSNTMNMLEWTDPIASDRGQRPSKHQSTIINDYKIDLIENLKDPASYRTSKQMLDLINNHNCVQALYDAWGYVDELLKLEASPTPYLPQYESLMKRVENHAAGDPKILENVYQTCRSKIWSLKKDPRTDLLLNINLEFQEVKGYFEKMTEGKKLLSMNENSQRYKDKTEREIAGLLGLIESHVVPNMERLMKTITEDTSELLKEITDSRDDIETDRRSKIQRKEELRRMIGWRVSLRVLQTLARLFTKSEGFISETDRRNRETLDKQIEIIEKGKKEYSEELFRVGTTLIGIRSKTGQLDTRRVRKTLRSTKTKLKGRISGATKYAIAAEAVELIGDTIGIFVESRERMDALESAIEEDEEKLDRLIDMENYVIDVLTPALETARNYKISATSRVDFNFDGWSLRTIARNVQEKMGGIGRNLQTYPELNDRWNQFKDSIDHLIHLYEQIHDARDRIGMTEYMNYGEETNPVLSQMELCFRYNVLYGEYNRFVEALKLTTFPFVRFYSIDEITHRGEITRGRINELESKLKKIELRAVRGIDDKIHYANFTEHRYDQDPFFVWENREYGKSIAELFEGKEIILLADIGKSRLPDAVKFNKIKLSFNGIDDHAIMNDFQISLTHLGNNRYKCGDKSYVVFSGEHTFNYSHANTDVTRYVKKVEDADAILSPYASWKIRITKRPKSVVDFAQLARYGEIVDLVLVGSGTYVNGDSSICREALDDYYMLDSEYLSSTRNARGRRAISGRKIVNRLQKLIRKRFGKRYIEFDSGFIVDRLDGRIFNEDYDSVPRVLYDFVTESNPNRTEPEFLSELKDIAMLAMVPEY